DHWGEIERIVSVNRGFQHDCAAWHGERQCALEPASRASGLDDNVELTSVELAFQQGFELRRQQGEFFRMMADSSDLEPGAGESQGNQKAELAISQDSHPRSVP